MLMFHGLALLLACGCQPLASGFEDISALFQKPLSTASTGSVSSHDNNAVVKALWPDLDGLLGDVEDSMKGVTETVGELTDGAVAKVDEIGQQMQNFADGVGQKIANALNRALEFVKKEADNMLSESMTEKAHFFEELNHALAVANDTLLDGFAQAADKVLVATWGRWQNLRILVDAAAKKIEKGLSAAHQGALATKFAKMIESALGSLDGFMDKTKTCSRDLHSLGQLGMDKAEKALLQLNDELNEALQHIANFLAKLQQTFQDVTEQISNALILSNEEVDRAFASVQHNVTSIAWRVRSSGREVVLGMHRGIVMVAKAKGLKEPEWHPVSAAPPPAAPAAAAAAPAAADDASAQAAPNSGTLGLQGSLLAFLVATMAWLWG